MLQLSVVMPVYNQQLYVARAVRSILEQTFKDFEFIIVDDGSTDRTIEVIESFRDPRIRLIRVEHGGFIEALKRGIAESKGEWIARMDSDDICRPDRLEMELQFLAAHPDCVFVTSFYGIVTPRNKFLTPSKSSNWHLLRPSDITLSTVPFCDPGTVFRRDLGSEIGYDDSFKWEKTLWYELLKRGNGAVLEEPLYFMRWRLGSVSRGQSKYPAQLHYQMHLKYDPENAVVPREAYPSASRVELKNIKKCVYFYAAARDFGAARNVIITAFRRYPMCRETFRIILFWLRLRHPFKVYGAAGVRLFPTDLTGSPSHAQN